MLAGIRDILIISTPHDLPAFQRLLGRRHAVGARALATPSSRRPTGWRRRSSSAAISSAGPDLPRAGRQHLLRPRPQRRCSSARPGAIRGATIFGYHVQNPERYGVVEFDARAARGRHRGEAGPAAVELRGHRALLLRRPRGRHRPARSARRPAASSRSPTSTLRYLDAGRAARSSCWAAAPPGSTPAPTSRCSRPGLFIETIEQRQGLKIACPEEIAFRMGFIDAEQVERLAEPLRQDGYGQYLRQMLRGAAVAVKVRRPTIPDVLLVEPVVTSDERGFFLETWHAERLPRAGRDRRASCRTTTAAPRRGVLRGLHYQIEQPQGKLVRVVQARSSTSRWTCGAPRRPSDGGSASSFPTANHRQLWIPPGFAHGFYVTQRRRRPDVQMHRLYAPEHERSLRWDDPDARRLPGRCSDGRPPLVSAKDAAGAAAARRADLSVMTRAARQRSLDHRRRRARSAGRCGARRRPPGGSSAATRAALDVTDAESVRRRARAGAARARDQRGRLHGGRRGRARGRARRGGERERARPTSPRRRGGSGARLIHLSTDFVFDGAQGRPYVPGDRPTR